MCTNISYSGPVSGVGKGAGGWFPITQATVAYDHDTHSKQENALLLDFVNYDIGTEARVALELDLDSGKALLNQLQAAIAAVEAGEAS